MVELSDRVLVIAWFAGMMQLYRCGVCDNAGQCSQRCDWLSFVSVLFHCFALRGIRLLYVGRCLC